MPERLPQLPSPEASLTPLELDVTAPPVDTADLATRLQPTPEPWIPTQDTGQAPPEVEQGNTSEYTAIGETAMLATETPRRTVLSRVLASRAVRTVVTTLAFVPGALALESATPAFADSSITATVVNPDNDNTHSVFDRTSPHLNDKTTEYLQYGDTVQLICGTNGDPVGSHQNTRWHLVKDITRPEAGTTYTADHWLDTPNKANEPTPGERECGAGDEADGGTAAGEQQPGTPPPESPVKSVFYSPDDIQRGLGDITKLFSDWAPGNCSPDMAAKDIPATVDTLAGWSKGRLGPMYFLEKATPAQLDQIHNIILFDPGSTSDFVPYRIFGVPVPGSDNKRCDWQAHINDDLARWLQRNTSNHLLVMTGRVSEEKVDNNNPDSRSTFAGLWKYYFAGIWSQTFANQAQICDYNYMDHTKVIEDFSYVVNEPTIACPPDDNGNPATSWNP